jgi:hypothetical protein
MTSTDNAEPANEIRRRSFKAGVIKYSLTPALNFFFNDYIRMSVAPKFSLLKIHNVRSTYTTEEEAIIGYDDARRYTFGIFEPSVLLQTGFKNNKWLKLDFAFNFAAAPFTTRSLNTDDYPIVDDSYNVESRIFFFLSGSLFIRKQVSDKSGI